VEKYLLLVTGSRRRMLDLSLEVVDEGERELGRARRSTAHGASRRATGSRDAAKATPYGGQGPRPVAGDRDRVQSSHP
jgi:hypothetical protein